MKSIKMIGDGFWVSLCEFLHLPQLLPLGYLINFLLSALDSLADCNVTKSALKSLHGPLGAARKNFSSTAQLKENEMEVHDGGRENVFVGEMKMLIIKFSIMEHQGERR